MNIELKESQVTVNIYTLQISKYVNDIVRKTFEVYAMIESIWKIKEGFIWEDTLDILE